MKLQTLTAEFEVVTPLFLGDAQGTAPELRPPPIKAQLRFWWRALNWAYYLNQAKGVEHDALIALHRAEAELFGSAASENGGGQGLLRHVRVVAIKSEAPKIDTKQQQPPGLVYLLGQGLFDHKTGLTRQPVNVGKFTLTLGWVGEAQRQDLRDCVLLWGLLGGLGSRSRRGWGSVVLTQLGDEALNFKSVEDYRKKLDALLDPSLTLDNLPPFTAFSKNTRIQFWSDESWSDSLNVLNQVGCDLLRYRSFGRDKKILGNEQAEQNFKDDHDRVLEHLTNKEKRSKTPPRRVIFGLPHNYFFSSRKQSVAINAVLKSTDRQAKDAEKRRASPLFIHIHKIGNQYIAVQSLIAAVFLPAELHIKATIKATPPNYFEDPVNNWADIRRYLDRHESMKVELKKS